MGTRREPSRVPMMVDSGGRPWSADKLEVVGRCPVCGAAARRPLHEGLEDWNYGSTPGLWTLHECGECGSAYLDPRPSRDAIGLAYRDYYTHRAPTREQGGRRSWGVAAIRERLASGYRRARFGCQEEPWSRLGVMAAHCCPSRRASLEAEMRHLPRLEGRGGRLLDVGCGDGSFLLRVCRAGWTVVGVDPDETAVEVARSRGLDVRRGGVESLAAGEEPFDVITLNHVLEHVHDPLDTLRWCRRLLKPGGFVWIATPNLRSLGHLRYGRWWRHLDPPRHLVLFTPDSLRRVLAAAGLTRVEDLPWRPLCKWTFPASEAICAAAGKKPTWRGWVRVRAWWADRVARRDPSVREFLTVSAWTVGD